MLVAAGIECGFVTDPDLVGSCGDVPSIVVAQKTRVIPAREAVTMTAKAARPTRLVWAKLDSTWSWTLTRLPGGRTRLVTRLRQRYRPRPGAIVTLLLAEFGDFPMMRKMLRGIKQRAEASAPHHDGRTSGDRDVPKVGVR